MLLSEKTTKILIFIGAIIFASLPFIYLWNEPFFDFNVAINKEYFGQFGDFATGVVGSIWALAGVILFYVALKDQRRDFKTNSSALKKQIEALNLQTDEFQLQRTELKLSRKVIEAQSNTLKKQQFESTFFALLNVYSEIVKDINSPNKGDYFSNSKTNLLNRFQPTKTPSKNHSSAIKIYVQFYFEQKEKLSHYFKSLYRLIRFIDDSTLNDKEKHFYSKVVRSQLKENEALMLFYNAQTEFGKNFCPLILKYNLFKHLPSISKMEFKYFDGTFDSSFEANRLFFCEWFYKLLKTFVQFMKEHKYDLLDEEPKSISKKFEDLNSYFELSTNDINIILLRVHLPDDMSPFKTHLDLDITQFEIFQSFLLFDALIYSQLRRDELDIVKNKTLTQIEYMIKSENGFNIVSDKY